MRLLRLLAIALILGIVPLFFVDPDGWSRHIPAEVYDFGHVGFFGLLALLTMGVPWLRTCSYPLRAGLVLMLILLLGIAIELLQPLFGRSAGLRDIWQNMIGAAAGVSLLAPRGAPRTLFMVTAAALVVLELQGPAFALWDRGTAHRQFPVLSEFETRFEHRRWSSGVPDDTVARTGERSLRLDLEPEARDAGTTLRRSFGDWSGYAWLEMSLYNPDDEPLRMTVSIRDRLSLKHGDPYHDRFDRSFTLERGWNDLRISIADIREAPAERSLHLSDLAEVEIFTSTHQQHHTFYLDRVRLTLD